MMAHKMERHAILRMQARRRQSDRELRKIRREVNGLGREIVTGLVVIAMFMILGIVW